MHITFIRPNLGDFRGTDAMEPIVFALLANRTPADVAPRFRRAAPPVPLDVKTDLVAMTVETYTARRAYQIAAHYRCRGMPVVMGGYHPSLLAEEAAQYCDALVIGDAEGVWERVVADAPPASAARVYRRMSTRRATAAGHDRSILRQQTLCAGVAGPVGRGCRLACDFCSIHAFYGTIVQRTGARRRCGARDLAAQPAGVLRRRQPVQRRADLDAADRAMTRSELRWSCQITSTSRATIGCST